MHRDWCSCSSVVSRASSSVIVEVNIQMMVLRCCWRAPGKILSSNRLRMWPLIALTIMSQKDLEDISGDFCF